LNEGGLRANWLEKQVADTIQKKKDEMNDERVNNDDDDQFN
jgi:hypothetical protein